MTPLPLRPAVRLLPADARDEVLVELLERRVRWGAGPGAGRTSMTIDLVTDLLVAA